MEENNNRENLENRESPLNLGAQGGGSLEELLGDIRSDNIFHAEDDEQPIEADTEIKGMSIEEMKNKSRKKRRSGLGHKGLRAVIWVAVIVIVAGILSVSALMAFTDFAGISFSGEKEYNITIPEGSSTEQIADILKEAGAIRHPLFFRLYSKIKGEDGKYQYGYYTVRSSSGYEGIISILQTVGAAAEEVEITVPEGSSVNAIAKLFEEKGMCTASEFKAAMSDKYSYDFIDEIPKESVYHLLEGYLYAETYRFAYVKDDGEGNAHRAIDKMLSTLNERVFTDENIKATEKLGYSMHEILTMASIVQLESGGSPDNMAKVAQVFYNRLNWNEAKLLGSTPTSNYPSERYDTNKYEGLPPGPLNSPSIQCIEAALRPDSSVTATYFVTDKNGEFYYNSSLSDHESTIRRLKNQGIWEY